MDRALVPVSLPALSAARTTFNVPNASAVVPSKRKRSDTLGCRANQIFLRTLQCEDDRMKDSGSRCIHALPSCCFNHSPRRSLLSVLGK